MSDLSSFLEGSSAWVEMESALNRGMLPSALAIVAPQSLHTSLLRKAAELWLCDDLIGCGSCPSCLAWSEDGHPDLIVASEEGAPSVDQCRRMSEELLLRPVVASRRIAVVPDADRMSLNSANSLLKITEEPPESGHLFFLLREDRMIPTLRSRVWTLRFFSEDLLKSVSLPSGKGQWIAWLGKLPRIDRGDLLLELEGMSKKLVEDGRFKTASAVDQLIFMAERTHLSTAMIGDLAFLSIEEEYPFERIFDDIW